MAICCILTLGFVLTGCSGIINVTNSSAELIYNGNAATVVDGYLYYGNAYTDISSYTTVSELDAAKEISYLAVYNLNEERDAKGNNFTPNGNTKFNSELIASDYQFMFVLGDYIYYLKPDEHTYNSDGSYSQQFSYPILTSTKLDGTSQNAFYEFEYSVTQIEVLKYDGDYYVVALSGERLISIKLNSKGSGTATILAEGVTSAAIPDTEITSSTSSSTDWNGIIYYIATDDDSNITAGQVYVNNANSTKTISKHSGTVEFLYRKGNIIVYSYQNKTGHTWYYYNDVTSSTTTTVINLLDKYNLQATSASDISILTTNAGSAIIFQGNAGLMFKNSRGSFGGSGLITIQDADGNEISSYTLMFFNGTMGYLLDSNNIYEVDFTSATQTTSDGTTLTLTARTLLTMTNTIVTSGNFGGLYSYSDGYIYFYAQLEELSEAEEELISAEKEAAGIEESDEDDSSITDTDSGYYLYRVSINSGIYELIGTTTYEERHSDYVYTA